MIKAVFFDFGGVLAEEGFREGLKAIGKTHGRDPNAFYGVAGELVYRTGYVTGEADESTFWNAVRGKTGISGEDAKFRAEILKRFVLRPEMLKWAEECKSAGLITAILSDQTNWLREIDRDTPFFHFFDQVFNSFELRKGKRDPSIFPDVCAAVGLRPEEVLFIDDNRENINRASGEGLNTIWFRDIVSFQKEIRNLVAVREQSPGKDCLKK